MFHGSTLGDASSHSTKNLPVLLAGGKSDSPVTLTLDGKLDSRDAHQGRRTGDNGTPATVTLPHRLELKESGWFLLRAITDVPHTFRFASTAPWCVVGGKPMPSRRTDAEFFLAWNRERAAAVGKAITDDAKRTEVLAEWKKAEDFWQLRASAK